VAGGVVSLLPPEGVELGAGCCHLEEVVAAVRGWRSGQRRRLEGLSWVLVAATWSMVVPAAI